MANKKEAVKDTETKKKTSSKTTTKKSTTKSTPKKTTTSKTTTKKNTTKKSVPKKDTTVKKEVVKKVEDKIIEEVEIKEEVVTKQEKIEKEVIDEIKSIKDIKLENAKYVVRKKDRTLLAIGVFISLLGIIALIISLIANRLIDREFISDTAVTLMICASIIIEGFGAFIIINES